MRFDQAELVSVEGKEIEGHYVLAKEFIQKWNSTSDCYLLVEGVERTLTVIIHNSVRTINYVRTIGNTMYTFAGCALFSGQRRSRSGGAVVLPVQPVRQLRGDHGGTRGDLAKIQTGRSHDENHGPGGHLPVQFDVSRQNDAYDWCKQKGSRPAVAVVRPILQVQRGSRDGAHQPFARLLHHRKGRNHKRRHRFQRQADRPEGTYTDAYNVRNTVRANIKRSD